MTALSLVAGGVALAALIVIPGLGFAQRLAGRNEHTRTAWLLDAAWIGLAINWLNVAVVRELGVSPGGQLGFLVGLAIAWAMVGGWLGRGGPRFGAAPPRERLGVCLVLVAVTSLGLWKAADIARPLHGHWYLHGADAAQFEGSAPEPMNGELRRIEGSDAGAFSIRLTGSEVTLTATDSATGQIALAMQGPVGSALRVGSNEVRVQRSVEERPDEGPVRRYLEFGVAAQLVDVNLQAGDSLVVEAEGDTLFVLPGSESVWAAHASGDLRFVHYYQLLNQVENQVWAQEMLQDRWATLNQPPGWSPQLTLATLMIVDDMPAASVLFLLVLVLVGASAVRLAVVVAPGAPRLAFAVPAAFVVAHGLLMIEPGSTNFPDSLYAAAVLAVATAIAERRVGWIAGLAIAAGLSRWPGVIVASGFLMVHGLLFGSFQWNALKRVWQWVAIGAVITAVGALAGVLQDVLFVLYFETFPEHWHGEYAATRLIPRVPGFYALWSVYTGGGLLLAAAVAGWTHPSPARSAARWLLGSAGLYSVLLATIDHHPTHYFLPLVAVTGVAVVAASDALAKRWMRVALPAAVLVGVCVFLNGGDVGLQPIEDMVEAIDATLNP